MGDRIYLTKTSPALLRAGFRRLMEVRDQLDEQVAAEPNGMRRAALRAVSEGMRETLQFVARVHG